MNMLTQCNSAVKERFIVESLRPDQVTLTINPVLESYPCQVIGITPLGPKVLQVWLRPPSHFPGYSAGQYVELQLADGTSRPFSIANCPNESGSLELHIEQRPDSDALCALLLQMQTYGYINVKPAAGDVGLKPVKGPSVFLAAGTGFSQIKALLEQHILDFGRDNDRSQTPLYLFWGADQPEQRYLESLVDEWSRGYQHFHYRSLNWLDGDTWHDAVAGELSDLSNCHVYACGSPQRVYQTLEQLERLGLPRSQSQSDVFAYAPRGA